MAVSPVHQAIRRRQNPVFGMSYHKPIIPPPEANLWWWHPDRVGVKKGPSWFEKQLREFGEDLAVTWNAYAECYLIWMRSPGFKAPMAWGWKLLFPVVGGDKKYAPLDERVFARLYDASAAKWGNGKRYFDRIESEILRDRAKAEANTDDALRYSAGEYFDYMKIKNIGLGSKFVNHFSG